MLRCVFPPAPGSLESTALRIISGLGNSEIQAQLARFINEPKSIVSSDSEELNRALVLNIVRALHITGGSAAGTEAGAVC